MATKKDTGPKGGSNKLSPTPPAIWQGSSAESAEREKRYQAEDDLRTMMKAKEIEKDKGRHGHMKKVAREKVAAMKDMC